MSRIRARGNKDTELHFARILRTGGIRGWRRHLPLPGRPDFTFRKERVVIFVDGCFWHGCPKHGTRPKSNTGYWHGKLARNKTRDQDPPDGLGLKVNYTTLRNFYLKNLPMRLAIQRRDEGGDWKILSQQAAVEPIEFQNLIRESLEREVFLRLRDVEPDNDKPLRWMQCLLRLRAQELRASRPVPTPASAPSN